MTRRSPSFAPRTLSSRKASTTSRVEEHGKELHSFKQLLQEQHVMVPTPMLYNNDLDALCHRFLRARKYVVTAAWTMFTNCLQWRQRVGADDALARPMDQRLLQLIRECRPSHYIGYDPEGHPIFLERLGKLDGRRIEEEGLSDEDILAYHLREMEFMGCVCNEASAQVGHTIDRVVTLMDAAGLTFSMLTGYTQQLFRLITSMDSDNYPESCHAIYIVNGGAAFAMIWRIVSNFVDKGTRDKVHVLGPRETTQVLAKACGGVHKVPDILGGGLDTQRARTEWLAKMDEVLAAAAAAAKAPNPQLTVACGLPNKGNITASADEDFATPMSAMSRLSSWSAASAVFFDARSSCSSPSWQPNIDEHSFLESEQRWSATGGKGQRTGSPSRLGGGSGGAAAAAAGGGTTKPGGMSAWRRAFQWGRHPSSHAPEQRYAVTAAAAAAAAGGGPDQLVASGRWPGAVGAHGAAQHASVDSETASAVSSAPCTTAAAANATSTSCTPSTGHPHDHHVPPSPTPVASVCATIGSGVGSAGAGGMSEHGGSVAGNVVQSGSHAAWDRGEATEVTHTPEQAERMPRCTCGCIIS